MPLNFAEKIEVNNMGTLSISRRGSLAQTSPLQRLAAIAEERKKAGIKVYHLNLGQPDLPTDPAAFTGFQPLHGKTLAYAPANGLASTIQAWKSYFHKMGIELSEDEMIVTMGGSEAIVFALTAVCDPGDEVLVFEPYYTNYNGLASLASVRLHPVPLSIRKGFHLPPPADIENYLGRRTKAILVCNPNNPTGTVYSRQELQGLVELAIKRDLFLLSDEVYREFSYESPHHSIMSFADAHDHAILLDSTSKRFNVCGARIGVLASRNPEVIRTVLKSAMARVSAGSLDQLAVETLLNNAPRYTRPLVEEFRKRREIVHRELAKMWGVTFYKPEGAFYVVVGLPVEDAEHFSRWLVGEFQDRQETFMLAPARGFYDTPAMGNSEVRIAFMLNCDELERALQIIAHGLEEYRR